MPRRRGIVKLVVLVAFIVGFLWVIGRDTEPPALPVGPILFDDVAAAVGIQHTHAKPQLDSKISNIMPWMASVGASVAATDYDRDGWIDLYVSNSRKGTPNLLYRNLGNGKFIDVAAAARLADVNDDRGVTTDCVWGDYDNDGWPDLYLVRWGFDSLYRNNGDGTFVDVTAQLFSRQDGEAGAEWANGNAALFFDYDNDGLLDIYVGNYFKAVDLWNLETTRIMHDDFEVSRNGGRNFLYRQLPGGGFEETASALGLDDPGWTLAVGSGDVDNDGRVDLYCANDFGPDQLFLNAGGGKFRNATDSAIGPDTKKGMNVDFGDFNNDGWLDIYVTNITTADYLKEGNMLWHNNGLDETGDVSLVDIGWDTGTHDGGWGWGGKFFDSDNDGDLDIIAVNGFISAGKESYWYALASWTVTGVDSTDATNWPEIGDRSFSGHEPIRYWRNDSHGRFTERAWGAGLEGRRDGRGIACVDYDNDGDVDVFIANQGQQPNFYRNRGTGQNYLIVTLAGDPGAGNCDAIGTRVTIVTASGLQIREREGGNGYSGQSDPRLHFGLGAADVVKLLEVRWPDGGLQYLEDVTANQILHLQQDPTSYASRIDLGVKSPNQWAIPVQASVASAPPAIAPEELEATLSQYETVIEEGTALYLPASAYRETCVKYGQHDRSIAFFEARVAAAPEDLRLRLELGCAYVDKIPTCGGLAAVVSKGTLARKSLDQLNHVIEKEGATWVTLYCRGMNHLHWPRALRHTDDAIADLSRCLEMQGEESKRPHHLRTYLALGDAYAKHDDSEKARETWRAGLVAFPDTPSLLARLDVRGDAALLRYVDDQRSLERAVDTSLTFLDSANP
ncbi:MAG: CRTAC1 family protein [Planctomycetota bacterium]